MFTATSMDTYRDQVAQLFQDVFRMMLKLEVTLLTEPLELRPSQVTSAVYFAGPWHGATLLECSLPLALVFTRRLMPDCDPQTFDDDVQDAMGELANIVGGNLKPLLPDGTVLSMPSVVQGSNYSMRLCGNHSHIRLPFVCAEGRFWITIVEGSNDGLH
ncbi:MAG: chemotaxis protein CheX [Acidobacteria bacterium]|nr:chemotaxis protein CheX [Acidobacteriota bacterium]